MEKSQEKPSGKTKINEGQVKGNQTKPTVSRGKDTTSPPPKGK